MREHIVTMVSLFGLLGIPTIFSMTVWCIKSCRSFFEQLKMLQEAQKAQMRGQLMDKYYEVKNRGFVWADELQEFCNQYDAYHVLKGKNAVLDARKDELLKMPSKVR